MIKTFEFVSAKGASMPLLNNQYFTLTEIDGFTTVWSTLSSVVVPFVDGDTVTNVQATPRSVVLYLRLRESAGIETAKRYVLQYVKPKLTGKIHLEQDGRNVELDGIVEAIDLPRFELGCTMAITMHCSMPYWQDVDYAVAEISEIINLHYFPIPQNGLAFPADGIPFGVYDDDLTQTVQNRGDVEAGMIIQIIATGTVVNPRIIDSETGEYIGVNDTLQGNDEITICTLKGQKSISKNGANVIDKILEGSTFMQIPTGDTEYTIGADSGIDNLYFTLSFKQRYI